MRSFRLINAATGQMLTMNEVDHSYASFPLITLFEIGAPDGRPDRHLEERGQIGVRGGYPYFDTQLNELIFWVPNPPPGQGWQGTWIDVNGNPVGPGQPS